MILCVPIFYLSTYQTGLQFLENNYTLEEEVIGANIASSVSRAAQQKTLQSYLALFL